MRAAEEREHDDARAGAFIRGEAYARDEAEVARRADAETTAEFDRLNGSRPVPNEPDDQAEDERHPTSWAPVDLSDALAGTDLPAPELLERGDRRCLIYRGRVHWFQGESETCKSWLAMVAVAQVLAAGGSADWLDFEDDDRGVVARLRALGVTAEAISARFTYVRPDEPLTSRLGGFTAAILDLKDLLEAKCDLAVIDGVTEALTTEGLSLLDNADIAKWLRLLPKRIADRTGAGVICIDHLPKDRDGQGRYAIGAQHKLAGVTGAAYKLESRKRFRRSDGGDPVEGTVAVTVMKDRPGWVRAHAANEDAVGTLTLTSWPDGGVTTSLEPAGTASPPDLSLCRKILEHLAIYDGLSGRKIEEAIGGKAQLVRDALKWIAEAPRGWVRIELKGASHLHYLTDTGRQEFDL